MTVRIDSDVVEDVVVDTWNTYLGVGIEPHRNEPQSGDNQTSEGALEARIRISGNSEWQVTLRGSGESAEEAARRMLASGQRFPDEAGDSAGVAAPATWTGDAWAELVNTLAGNLKAALDLSAHRLSMPAVFNDVPTQTALPSTDDGADFSFDWDGYQATVRIARVTPT